MAGLLDALGRGRSADGFAPVVHERSRQERTASGAAAAQRGLRGTARGNPRRARGVFCASALPPLSMLARERTAGATFARAIAGDLAESLPRLRRQTASSHSPPRTRLRPRSSSRPKRNAPGAKPRSSSTPAASRSLRPRSTDGSPRESGDANVIARALQARARSLAAGGEREAALGVLLDELCAGEHEAARDARGRGDRAECAALRARAVQGTHAPPRFTQAFQRLATQLTNYDQSPDRFTAAALLDARVLAPSSRVDELSDAPGGGARRALPRRGPLRIRRPLLSMGCARRASPACGSSTPTRARARVLRAPGHRGLGSVAASRRSSSAASWPRARGSSSCGPKPEPSRAPASVELGGAARGLPARGDSPSSLRRSRRSRTTAARGARGFLPCRSGSWSSPWCSSPAGVAARGIHQPSGAGDAAQERLARDRLARAEDAARLDAPARRHAARARSSRRAVSARVPRARSRARTRGSSRMIESFLAFSRMARNKRQLREAPRSTRARSSSARCESAAERLARSGMSLERRRRRRICRRIARRPRRAGHRAPQPARQRLQVLAPKRSA